MGLLSFLQRKPDAVPAAAAESNPVDVARRRARRRLIGATVLVLLGVIGLPMVFDTAPRPLPVDIAIDIPSKDTVPPLTPPTGPAKAQPAGPSAAGAVVPTSPPDERAAAADPGHRPDAAAAPVAPATTPAGTDAAADAARAQAALDNKPVPAPTKATPAENGATKTGAEAPGRFIVQIGAFSGADSARDARARVEKLGLKTYTQVVDTPAGQRIRVRVGPYGDRGQAEKAAAQLRQAGMTPAVITL